MHFLPIKIRKLLPPEDDLLVSLEEALPTLQDGDIVCIASKVVAIHQGRTRKMTNDKFLMSKEKRELVSSEAEWVDDEMRPFLTITNGQFIPFAGVDESNGNGYYVLWPEDPMRMAREMLEWIRGKSGVHHLGVIITDSTCLPLRNGTIGTAIGFAGFEPVKDYRGTKDLFDRTMELSQVNVADSLAATATLVMGEGDESTPVVIIRAAEGMMFTDADHSNDVKIAPADDIFAPILSATIPSSPTLPTIPGDWSEDRPFFTLVAVSSLGGIIAPEGLRVEEWASEEDQKWFHALLPTFDATILGRTTYEALPGSKDERNRVVLTTGVASLEKKDDRTWFIDPIKTDLLGFLNGQGWNNVGVTGGRETYSFFIRQGWADRLLLTMEPLVFGDGIRSFTVGTSGKFRLAHLTRLNANGTLLCSYEARTPLSR